MIQFFWSSNISYYFLKNIVESVKTISNQENVVLSGNCLKVFKDIASKSSIFTKKKKSFITKYIILSPERIFNKNPQPIINTNFWYFILWFNFLTGTFKHLNTFFWCKTIYFSDLIKAIYFWLIGIILRKNNEIFWYRDYKIHHFLNKKKHKRFSLILFALFSKICFWIILLI